MTNHVTGFAPTGIDPYFSFQGAMINIFLRFTTTANEKNNKFL
jgi:hypothetical protein